MSHARTFLDVQQLSNACTTDPNLQTEFLQCQSYQELLQVLFAAKKHLHPKFSFAMFAKRAGFAGRGFAKDVIAGRKRLTNNSLRRIIKGLDLADDLAEFFSYQVASQEVDVEFRDLTKTKMKQLLAKQRIKINNAISTPTTPDVKPSPFRNPFAPKVYAALGDLDRGSNLKEIKIRTGFSLSEVTRALQSLEAIGMVEQTFDGHYRATIHDVYIQEREAASAFKEYYSQLIGKKSIEAATANFDDPTKLYWLSHASVKTQDLPKFKQDLRDLLRRYVETIEDSSGDKIVDLCVSFT